MFKRHLDLFSGIGGFAIAAGWAGYNTIAFCDIDPFCQRVLVKNFPGIPVYGDIRSIKGDEFGEIDLLTGGFPCQPFSGAGERRGQDDDRHLWPEMRRVIGSVQPRWIIAENVNGIISLALDDCLDDLEALHYDTRTVVLPAGSVGTRHKRNRVWILAHAQRPGLERVTGSWLSSSRGTPVEPSRLSQWISEPGVARVVHGIPDRVDRTKTLGNAIVPHLAYELIRLLDMEYKDA